MNPPKTVKIGPTKWKIRTSKKAIRKLRLKLDIEDHLIGHTELKDLTIFIAYDIAPQVQRDTLIHELLHACFAIQGFPPMKDMDEKEDQEEWVVKNLTSVLHAVIRDNPELIAYLTLGDENVHQKDRTAR